MFALTNEQLMAQLFSLVLPLVVSMFLRPTMSDRRRALISFAIMLVAVVLVQLALVQLADVPNDWQSWLRFVLTSLVVAATSYQTFWKSTGLAQRWEARTSPPSEARERLIDDAERKARPPMDVD